MNGGSSALALAATAWIALFSSITCADTLTGAVTRALTHLPEVRAAHANLRAAEQTAAQARSAWYPTLDFSLGHGRETSNNPSTRVLASNQTLTRREAEANLSQLLFDGGAASGQARRFQARAESAGDLLASAAESAAAKAAQAYLDVARLRDLIAIAEDNERRHKQTLDQVSRLADVGQGRRADAHQAEARHALAQASLTQLRSQLDQAETAFLHLTGQPPGALAKVDSLRGRLPDELKVALAQATEMHPAIRSAHKELLAAQAERDSQRDRFASPRVALEVGTSKNQDLDGLRGVNADRYAMVRLRYNLYRGGADEARLKEAEARVDEAMANLGKAHNDVERDLRLAWRALADDRIRLPQLERYAAASAQVVTAYRLQFSIGQRTLLDVLNAENELFNARSSLDAGTYAVTQDELRLLATMGKLLATLGVTIAPDAEAKVQLARKTDEEQQLQQAGETKAGASAPAQARPMALAQDPAGKDVPDRPGHLTSLSLRLSTTLGVKSEPRLAIRQP